MAKWRSQLEDGGTHRPLLSRGPKTRVRAQSEGKSQGCLGCCHLPRQGQRALIPAEAFCGGVKVLKPTGPRRRPAESLSQGIQCAGTFSPEVKDCTEYQTWGNQPWTRHLLEFPVNPHQEISWPWPQSNHVSVYWKAAPNPGLPEAEPNPTLCALCVCVWPICVSAQHHVSVCVLVHVCVCVSPACVCWITFPSPCLTLQLHSLETPQIPLSLKF